jgi:integrase
MTSKITIQDRHARIVKAAGVPKVPLHSLRHTFATLMLEQGVHPLIVSDILGHSSIATTMDVYSHVSTNLQREALSKLQETFLRDDVTPRAAGNDLVDS